MRDYLEENRRNWDERVPVHLNSSMYRVHRYIEDEGLISNVVRFDEQRLGSLQGVRAMHLQCHIGTDTISLARLGASVTGVDFSSEAIAAARWLANAAGCTATRKSSCGEWVPWIVNVQAGNSQAVLVNNRETPVELLATR